MLQISFCHRDLIYVYLKKYLALYVVRLGCKFAAMLFTFVCILQLASHICINPTADAFLVSRVEYHPKRRKQFFFWENMDFSKKLVCYFARLNFNIFLKQRCMNVRYFELTWLYASIWLLILCSFDFEVMGDFGRLNK